MNDWTKKYKDDILYLALTIYWVILFLLTSLPSVKVPATGINDKIEHTAAYFVLGILLNLVLIRQNKSMRIRHFSAFITILIGIIYGAMDEVHQLFIPGRSMEFYDWIGDCIGIILAVTLVAIFRKFYYSQTGDPTAQ